MASAATARGVLCRLRRDIARIEGRLAEADRLAFVREGRGASEDWGVSGRFDAAEDGVDGDSGAMARRLDGLPPPAAGLAVRFPPGLPVLDAF